MLNDGTDYSGNVLATLTAGEWEGSFNFNINFDENSASNYKKWSLVKNTNFKQNGNTWTSTNHDDNSIASAKWIINLDNTSTLLLPYEVSSEENNDVFNVKLDEEIIINNISGEISDIYEIELTKGEHIIEATYTKNDSENINKDEVNLELNIIKDAAKLDKISWSEIAEISESGEAANYFAVGDEKKITLNNGETYTLQIIGINHDDLSSGGKAGVTFQFKEVMSVMKHMNDGDWSINTGGWSDSKMRTYVNNDVYTLLPVDLQKNIKLVNKKSDIGNKDSSKLRTTSDKLFLLSSKEINRESSSVTSGQGSVYEFYLNGENRIKYKVDTNLPTYWWTRSAGNVIAYNFGRVTTQGLVEYSNSYFMSGVAPAFCI